MVLWPCWSPFPGFLAVSHRHSLCSPFSARTVFKVIISCRPGKAVGVSIMPTRQDSPAPAVLPVRPSLTSDGCPWAEQPQENTRRANHMPQVPSPMWPQDSRLTAHYHHLFSYRQHAGLVCGWLAATFACQESPWPLVDDGAITPQVRRGVGQPLPWYPRGTALAMSFGEQGACAVMSLNASPGVQLRSRRCKCRHVPSHVQIDGSFKENWMCVSWNVAGFGLVPSPPPPRSLSPTSILIPLDLGFS